jgi:acetyl-CoA carboxylase biotin carboxyl carrier protein
MATVELKSEVTGSVWQIKKQPGEAIAEGDIVMILESMKMEIPVVAEDAGTLKELVVKEAEAVAEGQTVAILET